MSGHFFTLFFEVNNMEKRKLMDLLEQCPVIAAVHDRYFDKAIHSPCEVIFLLGSNILTIPQRIREAHEAGKCIFVHTDLADGLGKDRAGVQFCAQAGADGIISTRANLIRAARDLGLLTVQRFFALDSQGVDSIQELLDNSCPDLMEIMPGVIGKIIKRFANAKVPLIAGGLVETKEDVTSALKLGAFAVSTGKEPLWYI